MKSPDGKLVPVSKTEILDELTKLKPEERQEIRAKLNELDVSQVEPTAHAVPLVNVTRPDEIRPSLSNEDALRNAPAQANGLFIVPKIVE